MKALLIALVVLETLAIGLLLAFPAEPPTIEDPAPERTDLSRSNDLPGPDATEPKPGTAAPEPDALEDPPSEETEPTSTVVYGRVTDPAGDVLPVNVSLGLLSPKGGVFEAFYREEDGSHARAEVAPGIYRFRAVARGYAAYDAMIEVPPATPYLEHHLRMSPLAEVPVRIVAPDGTPLEKAVPAAAGWLARSLGVIATSETPPARLRATHDPIHDSYGRAEYLPASRERDPRRRDGRAGTLRIRGELPVQLGLYLRRERLQVRRLDRMPDEIVFRLEPETVRSMLSGVTFRLTGGASPEDLAEVLVLLHDASEDDPDEDTFERDGDRITVRGHPPGDLHLQVHAADALAPYLRNVELPPGRILDLGTVHLGPLVRRSIRILNAEDEPVVGATIWPYELESGWDAQRGMPVRFVSDANGLARLALGAHRYGLLIREPGGGWHSAEVDLSAEGSEIVDLPIPSLTSFALRTGEIELPVSVKILNAEDRVVTARKLRLPTIWPLALAAGDYTMIVIDRDGEERPRPLRVREPMSSMVVIE